VSLSYSKDKAMLFEYGTLKLIWWFLITALFVLFFILGGRDFGVCILLPWLSKRDDDRRLVINSISGTWEGNQVWFITAAGALFAAWPIVYATAFSALYFALMLVLLSLILRPPGFDYRDKLPAKTWRQLWDWSLFMSGFVPTILFGIGLGNIILGIPFYFDESLQSHYEGNFWQLLNPFSMMMGLTALVLMTFHGGIYLQYKLQKVFSAKLTHINMISGGLFLILFWVMGYWVAYLTPGYEIASSFNIHENLLPSLKSVSMAKEGWLSNFMDYPLLWFIPALCFFCAALAIFCSFFQYTRIAIGLAAMTMTAALATINAALFPFILPSSSRPEHSLTLWDAVSSHRTLQYMFYVAVFFLPIVLSYTFWVFRILRGTLTHQDLLSQSESY